MGTQIVKDSEYTQWIARVADGFMRCRVQATMRVNSELLQFYWSIGHDIDSRQMDNRYGSQFYANASRDIRSRLGHTKGLSETNIRYAKRFYCLYSQLFGNLQQPAEKLGNALESMSQPLGISEYALTKVYPEKFTSSLPSIEDIENSLNDSNDTL